MIGLSKYLPGANFLLAFHKTSYFIIDVGQIHMREAVLKRRNDVSNPAMMLRAPMMNERIEQYSAFFARLEMLHSQSRAGDKSSHELLAALIREFGFKYAWWHIRFPRDIADDFAQEFYFAYQQRQNDIDKLRPWLLKVAGVLANLFMRKGYRWNRGKELSLAWQVSPESPEQQIIDRLEAQKKMRACTRRDSQILYWRLWRNLSYGEIAKKLGLKTGNVKQLYYRALKRLAAKTSP